MKARVLIVDDEPDFLNLVAFKLVGQGFDVISAATGLEGLSRARCDAPELIVLDLMLPDLDGLTVCRILRSQPATRGIPVIILSALEEPAKSARAQKDKPKFSCWIKKGVALEVLTDAIRDALAHCPTAGEPA